MSKNIKILEGGEARVVSDVSKLFTNLSNDKTQLWIPEDEAVLSGKFQDITVGAEGTYKPKTGYDGIINVSVNIPKTKKVKGKENGQTVTYSVTDEGYLVGLIEEVD